MGVTATLYDDRLIGVSEGPFKTTAVKLVLAEDAAGGGSATGTVDLEALVGSPILNVVDWNYLYTERDEALDQRIQFRPDEPTTGDLDVLDGRDGDEILLQVAHF